MERVAINPEAQMVAHKIGMPIDEVWTNDVYECQVRFDDEDGRAGMVYLSIKRHNRGALRDWRHLQSIKNEVVGPEREAIEIYPAESRLVDQANQSHLWVFPEDVKIPLGFNDGRVVQTREESAEIVKSHGIRDNGKMRQRDWQPGLRTGKGLD
jgi:hypothetical protein